MALVVRSISKPPEQLRLQALLTLCFFSGAIALVLPVCLKSLVAIRPKAVYTSGYKTERKDLRASIKAKLKHNRYSQKDKGKDISRDRGDAARIRLNAKKEEEEEGKGSEAWLYYTLICLPLLSQRTEERRDIIISRPRAVSLY